MDYIKTKNNKFVKSFLFFLKKEVIFYYTNK